MNIHVIAAAAFLLYELSKQINVYFLIYMQIAANKIKILIGWVVLFPVHQCKQETPVSEVRGSGMKPLKRPSLWRPIFCSSEHVSHAVLELFR